MHWTKLRGIVFLIALIAIWEVASRSELLNPLIMPLVRPMIGAKVKSPERSGYTHVVAPEFLAEGLTFGFFALLRRQDLRPQSGKPRLFNGTFRLRCFWRFRLAQRRSILALLIGWSAIRLDRRLLCPDRM